MQPRKQLLCGGTMFLMLTAAVCFAADKPEPLSVPAFTAYIEPDPGALSVSEKNGVSGWSDIKEKVVWHGEIKTTGKLDISVSIRLPAKAASSLKLTVADQSLTAEFKPLDSAQTQTVAFGSVNIATAGYQSFTLEGLTKDGKTFGEVEALLLSGPAAADAHFNLKPRRNAASVHLGYPIPKDAKVVSFYNEVTVRTEPLSSYYMVCGFRRGYFGIQTIGPTERHIIFSIWDSGSEGNSRDKVKTDDRVQLIAKGPDVYTRDFGGEGTGGHSHLVYNWEKDKTYRFMVCVKPEGTHTTYSGYFYFPEKKQWGLIATFRAPKDGNYLNGLYSFNEDFNGANGDKRRLSEFGNQWIKTDDDKWIELTAAHFTHDPTGKADRKDYGAGVVNGRFYLSNGGFVADPIKFGDKFERPA